MFFSAKHDSSNVQKPLWVLEKYYEVHIWLYDLYTVQSHMYIRFQEKKTKDAKSGEYTGWGKF